MNGRSSVSRQRIRHLREIETDLDIQPGDAGDQSEQCVGNRTERAEKCREQTNDCFSADRNSLDSLLEGGEHTSHRVGFNDEPQRGEQMLTRNDFFRCRHSRREFRGVADSVRRCPARDSSDLKLEIRNGRDQRGSAFVACELL